MLEVKTERTTVQRSQRPDDVENPFPSWSLPWDFAGSLPFISLSPSVYLKTLTTYEIGKRLGRLQLAT